MLCIRVPSAAGETTDTTSSQNVGRVFTGSNNGPQTVLVVDDDPSFLTLMERMIAREGYEAALAHSARSGIEMARELHPFLILLDVNMPEVDGWEALREIKADRELRNSAVVMVTISDDRQRGRELGALGHLMKPISRERLSDLLSRTTPSRQSRQIA